MAQAREKLLMKDLVVKYRAVIGLSQVQLAAQAGVSLPTIQNIESGKAKNPSIDVIERLCNVLGLRVAITVRPCDWVYLAFCGVPLAHTSPDANAFNVSDLRRELSRAVIELNEKNSKDKSDALIGYFLAVRDHYGDLTELIGVSFINHFLNSRKIEPRHFKLRQTAFSRLKKLL